MLKMYIIVRCDLTPQQRTVQACHAVARFVLTRGSVGRPIIDKWDTESGVMVSVGVKNERELEMQEIKLRGIEACFSVFREPDMKNQKTALVTIVDEDCHVVKKLELL